MNVWNDATMTQSSIQHLTENKFVQGNPSIQCHIFRYRESRATQLFQAVSGICQKSENISPYSKTPIKLEEHVWLDYFVGKSLKIERDNLRVKLFCTSKSVFFKAFRIHMIQKHEESEKSYR
ncbi:uncharacterized protein LOC121241795 isoform X2 [Juglans microcarpa x Juglans regia]|uniref:uncharacterized protein LOC121241795 isoform X2 n=1 Tax=Juglans microcarpa x Juglans regia TaxID=2249226 RepID=UPI001B7DD0FD|nr:uncharacterized protein LOC121241795 isoform X2 [Juglans microcarpa x Juglans regia]